MNRYHVFTALAIRSVQTAVRLGLVAALALIMGPSAGSDGTAPVPDAQEERARAAAKEQALLADLDAHMARNGLYRVDVSIPRIAGTCHHFRFHPPSTLDNHPNVDWQFWRPLMPFYAPEGVTNVALNKPVTASEPEPIIGEPAMVTDGDKSGIDGSYFELGPGLQWVQIDLQRKYDIYGIWVWHYHQEFRAYNDVVVMVADDVDCSENVRIIYNNDHDNSSGLGKGKDIVWIETNKGRLIQPQEAPEAARFVRLYSHGSSSHGLNHYVEVEVYGREPEAD